MACQFSFGQTFLSGRLWCNGCGQVAGSGFRATFIGHNYTSNQLVDVFSMDAICRHCGKPLDGERPCGGDGWTHPLFQNSDSEILLKEAQ